MQTHKNLASGEKSGNTLAIMNSEQAHPRRCGKEKAGDAFTSLSAMSRRRAERNWRKYNNTRPDPIF